MGGAARPSPPARVSGGALQVPQQGAGGKILVLQLYCSCIALVRATLEKVVHKSENI